jgi:uncharacterized protein
MVHIWGVGNLAEVQRLVGQDPGLVNAKDQQARTPLILASRAGHAGVVRWLLDQGAAVNEWTHDHRVTALWLACYEGRLPVVTLLLQMGADPTIADHRGMSPLMIASAQGHLKVVRVLLSHPTAKASITLRDDHGKTALWWSCCCGRGGVARALLERGADPTIANNDGTTPMAVAMEGPPHHRISAEGQRACVAALQVSFLPHQTSTCS